VSSMSSSRSSAFKFLPFRSYVSSSGLAYLVNYQNEGVTKGNFRILSNNQTLYEAGYTGLHRWYGGSQSAPTQRLALSSTGIITATSALRGGTGTASLPTFTFVEDTTSGIARLTDANLLAIVTAGATAMKIEGTGDVHMGDYLDIQETGAIQGYFGSEDIPTYSFTTDTTAGLYNNDIGSVAISTAALNRMSINEPGDVDIYTGNLYLPGNAVVTGTLTVNDTTNAIDLVTGSIVTPGGLRVGGNLSVTGTMVLPTGTVASPAYTFTSDTDSGITHHATVTGMMHLVTGGVNRVTITSASGTAFGGALLNNAGAVQAADGDATEPAFAFATDIDTGIYFGASDSLDISTGGVNRVSTNSVGNVEILTGNLLSEGAANIIGTTSVHSTTQSTSVDTGSVIADGGMGISNDFNVTGDATVAGTLTVPESGYMDALSVGTSTPLTINTAGQMTITNTGAQAAGLSGGLGMGGNLQTDSNVSIGSGTPITIDTNGSFSVSNTTTSTNATTGCAVFQQSTAIVGNFSVGGLLTSGLSANQLHVDASQDLLHSGNPVGVRYTLPLSSLTTATVTDLAAIDYYSLCYIDSNAVFLSSQFTMLISATKAGRAHTVRIQVAITPPNPTSPSYDMFIHVLSNQYQGTPLVSALRTSAENISAPALPRWHFDVLTNDTAIELLTARIIDFIGVSPVMTAIVANVGGTGKIQNWDFTNTDLTSIASGTMILDASRNIKLGASTGTSPLVISQFGQVTVNNTSTSANATVGSAVFKGGVGITGIANMSGLLFVDGVSTFGTPATVTVGAAGTLVNTNIFDSVNAWTGSAIFKGGIGVASGVFGSGALFVGSTAAFGTSTPLVFSNTGVINVKNTIGSSSSSTGSAIFAGGIGVVKKIAVTGNLGASDSTTIGSSTPVAMGVTGSLSVANTTSRSVILKGGLGVTGAINCSGPLTVSCSGLFGNSDILLIGASGLVKTQNTASSVDRLNAAVVFKGGVGITENLNVTGNVKVTEKAVFGSSTTGGIESDGVLTLRSVLDATTSNTGCFAVSGGIGVAGNVACSGALTVSATGTFGQATSVPVDFGTTGFLLVRNTTSAPAVGQGCAILQGGMGVAGAINTSGILLVNTGTQNLGSPAIIIGPTGNLIVQNTTTSTTTANGCATFGGGIGVAGNMAVTGTSAIAGTTNIGSGAATWTTISSTGILTLNCAFAATSCLTGSAVYSGGMGVLKDIRIGTNLNTSGPGFFGNTTQFQIGRSGMIAVNNATESTSTSVGCAVFAGGIGITGSLNSSGALSVATGCWFGTSTQFLVGPTGNITVQNTTASTNSQVGCAKFSGGLGVNKEITVLGTLNVSGPALFGNSTPVYIGPTGWLIVQNTTQSTSSTNGCAVFSGGVGVTGQVACTGTLNVNNQVEIGNGTPWRVYSDGRLLVQCTTASTTATTGCAKFAGGIGITGNLNVSGIFRASGLISFGQTTPLLVSTTGILVVQNNTQSTYSGEGCAIFKGGVAIVKELNGSGLFKASNAGFGTTTPVLISSSGTLKVANTTASTHSGNGCAVFLGGVGVATGVAVTGALKASGTTSLGTTTPFVINSNGSWVVNNTISSTNSTTGSLVTVGGMAVVGNINSSGTTRIGHSGLFGTDLTKLITTSPTGVLVVNNTLGSTSPFTGCAVFAGGIGIAQNLSVTGNLNLSTGANIGTTTPVNIGKTGALVINNANDTTAHNVMGCFLTNGGVGVGGNINCSGVVNLSGPLTIGSGGSNPITIGSTGWLVVTNTSNPTNYLTAGCVRSKGGFSVVKNLGISGAFVASGGMEIGSTTPLLLGQTITVQNETTVAGGGCCIVDGGMAIGTGNLNFNVTGNASTNNAYFGTGTVFRVNSDGSINVINTRPSNNSTIGAAIFNGGIGVAQDVRVGLMHFNSTGLLGSPAANFNRDGVVKINNTTTATTTTAAAVVLKGGLGVATGMYITNSLAVSGSANFGTSTTLQIGTDGSFIANNTSTTSVKFKGGIGITGGISCSGSLAVSGSLTFADSVSVLAGTTGILKVSNTTTSTASTNGAAIFKGGIGIAENANIGGAMKVSGAASFATGYFTVSSVGVMNVNSTIATTNKLTGSAVFSGGIGVAENVRINTNLNTSGVSRFGTSTPVTIGSTGLVTVKNTTDVDNTPGVGCFVSAGAVGITKELNIGNTGKVKGTMSILGNATVTKITDITGMSVGAFPNESTGFYPGSTSNTTDKTWWYEGTSALRHRYNISTMQFMTRNAIYNQWPQKNVTLTGTDIALNFMADASGTYGTDYVGAFGVPANSWYPGRVYRFEAFLSKSGPADAVWAMNLKINGTIVANEDTTAYLTNEDPVHIIGYLSRETTTLVHGFIYNQQRNNSQTVYAMQSAYGTGSFDSSIAQTLALTYKLSDGATGMNIMYCTVTQMG